MIPRTVGLIGYEINFIVMTALASMFAVGSISVFNLAHNLQNAPIGIVGLALATAAFPTLSENFYQKNHKDFIKNFMKSARFVIFMIIPTSVLVIILRAQITRIILGTGRFDWIDTRLTAAALGVFAIGILAQSLIPLFAKTFYSLQNTKTPVIISLIAIAVNIGLAFFFSYLFDAHGWFSEFLGNTLRLHDLPDFKIVVLPLAFIISSYLQLGLLGKHISKEINKLDLLNIVDFAIKIIIISGVAGAATFVSLRPLSMLFDLQTGFGVLMQGLIGGGIGILTFLGLAHIMNIQTWKEIKSEIL